MVIEHCLTAGSRIPNEDITDRDGQLVPWTLGACLSFNGLLSQDFDGCLEKKQ